MINRIEPLVATIPEVLQLAAVQKTLVPFIGAGASQLGGCLGWNEFANAAIYYFVQHGKINHAQLHQIAPLPSRIKLSLALNLQSQHNLPIDFADLLKPNEVQRETGDKVYATIAKLESRTFVTTNYDQWLDGIRQPFFRQSDITVENLEVPNAVFHIHGSITDPDNMVITTADYLRRYASHGIDGNGGRENPFLTFLQKLFELKNVLFIGYSLSELEVLEYVLQKAGTKPLDGLAPKHYILQGFYSHELELARSLEGYFLSLGVGLLPFSKDENNWGQLIHVLEDLVVKLPSGMPLALPVLREMEGLLE